MFSWIYHSCYKHKLIPWTTPLALKVSEGWLQPTVFCNYLNILLFLKELTGLSPLFSPRLIYGALDHADMDF